MTFSLLVRDLYILNMKTRMPFRYGIAVMTALPCLFVRLTVEIDGQPVYGFSSDGLAPKWFTKDPESHYRDDIADMLRVVQQAFRHGQEMGGTDTIFALWRGIYDQQQRTPAMAAGITDYLWTMEQLLRFRAPPWRQTISQNLAVYTPHCQKLRLL